MSAAGLLIPQDLLNDILPTFFLKLIDMFETKDLV